MKLQKMKDGDVEDKGVDNNNRIVESFMENDNKNVKKVDDALLGKRNEIDIRVI